jgi:uncharacterized integral membrane protein
MAVGVGLQPKAGALPDASPDTELVPLGSVLGTVPERRYSLPPGIAWRRVGPRPRLTKGGVLMREGPSNSGSQAQARGLGAGAIASLTGVGLLLIFMFQNTESVRLDFLFWGFTWPLWLLTLASAFLGALVWFGIGVMRRHRRRKERRQDRRG